RQAIEEKRYLRGELQKKEARAAEKLTETELRHAVGEYDESQWEQVHKEVLAELVSVREDLQSVEADIHKLQELDALVSHRPAPHPSTAAPAPPRSRPQAKPEKVVAEDELAFIKSVTEDDQTAPSARRASGAQFQPTIPGGPGRLVGGGGAAHALERGSQSGALGTVVLGMRPRLAHRLLGGLDSRHRGSPGSARKIEGKCWPVKALRR